MQTFYDQMRNDIHKVYRVARESTELQGVPSETLDIMRDGALAQVDAMEADAKASKGGCDCCGCGQCG